MCFNELDLLGPFLKEGLVEKVSPNKSIMIIGGSSDIDKEYYEGYLSQLDFGSDKK